MLILRLITSILITRIDLMNDGSMIDKRRWMMDETIEKLNERRKPASID